MRGWGRGTEEGWRGWGERRRAKGISGNWRVKVNVIYS